MIFTFDELIVRFLTNNLGGNSVKIKPGLIARPVYL